MILHTETDIDRQGVLGENEPSLAVGYSRLAYLKNAFCTL